MSFYARQRSQDEITTSATPTMESLSSGATTSSIVTETPKANNKPEIGGSEAGFIGLIVGLALIFLLSCITIFFLLRNWTHGGRTVRGKSGRVGVESSSRRDRFRRGTLFGFRSKSSRDGGSGRGKGWVRAPGDEAEGEGEDEVWDARDVGMGAYDDPYEEDVETMKLQQGVREAVEVRQPRSGSSYAADLNAPGNGRDEERNRTSIVRTTTPDTLRNYPSYVEHLERERKVSEHARHESLDSAETAVSPSSFPGGTRFKEDLD